MKTKIGSAIKHGPKNSKDQPTTESGINDDPSVDQRNCFIEETQSGH